MSQALVGGPRNAGAPLRRHHSDRWLGGVAGGIARYVGTDPTLIRAAIVVLTIFGGAAVPFYIAAALLMPADGEPTSVAERILKNKRGEWSKPAVVIAALLAITVFGAQSDGPIGSLFPLLLLGGGVYLLTNRSGGQPQVATTGTTPTWTQQTSAPMSGVDTTASAAGAPPMNAPPPPTIVPGFGDGPVSAPPPPPTPGVVAEEEDPILAAARELDAEIYDPTPTWQPYTYEPEPVPFVPKRRRNPLVGIALSALVIGGGLSILTHAAGLGSISLAAFAAVGLLMVGGALILSRPTGGARLLLPVGAVLFLMAVIPDVAGEDFGSAGEFPGAVGDHRVAPLTLTGPNTEFRYGAGDVVIDLSAVEITGAQQQVTAFLGAGDMKIMVPDDLRVIANAGAGAGDVDLFGQESTGLAPGGQITLNDDVEGGTLIIDANIGGGDLELVQVPRQPRPELESTVGSATLDEPSQRDQLDVDELEDENESERLVAELEQQREQIEAELDAERDRIEAELDAERDRIDAELESLQEDGS